MIREPLLPDEVPHIADFLAARSMAKPRACAFDSRAGKWSETVTVLRRRTRCNDLEDLQAGRQESR